MTVKIDQYGPRVPITTREELARHIEDTRLFFDPGQDSDALIRDLCENAKKEGFRAVCVRPQHVSLAASLLEGSSVLVACVIGFPTTRRTLEDELAEATLGDMPWEDKVAEMSQARLDGADEFDVVMNTACFRETSAETTESPIQFELAQLVEHSLGTPIKLIIETDVLNDEEIAMATNAAINAGIQVVKNSTGSLTGGQGATVDSIKVIYNTIENSVSETRPRIKASGGIRSAHQALELIENGADMIGTSAGSIILKEFLTKEPPLQPDHKVPREFAK